MLMSFNALAEYRVYQYIHYNKMAGSEDEPSSFIKVSTLSPQSYIAYHGGSTLVTVDLMRTWVCPGNTAKKDICKSPYDQVAQGDL